MKKAIVISFLVLVIGALGFWFYGRPAFRHYKQNRALRQANAFLAKQQYREASLSARQALQLNPNNLEACRIMAHLAEISHAPQALDWRRRIVELAPTTDHKLEFAAMALQLQGPPFLLARQTLDELASTASNSPAYHALAAQLALKSNQPQKAQTHFEAAVRLEPTNSRHPFNLAVLQLRSTNAAVATEARAMLDRLCADTNLSVLAFQWLIEDSRARKDLEAAQRFSRQLLNDPRVGLDDHLRHLDLLRQSKDPEFDTFLRKVQARATNAVIMPPVASWMIANELTNQALQWLTNSPPAIREEQPMPLAIAEAYSASKDWKGLEVFLESRKWGEMEFLRQALLSRAAAEQRRTQAAELYWRQAVHQAGGRLGPLTTLLSLASNWGRTDACETLLWQIVQKFPAERWAIAELDRLYSASGNTAGLNKLFAAMSAAQPKDRFAKNNFAATCLLLRLNLTKAHETARDLYIQHPEESIIASTYAYSLHLQNRTQDGLNILEKLKPEALAEPGVALYYGALLIADKQTNKASHYLALARNSKLLPEEKKLLEY